VRINLSIQKNTLKQFPSLTTAFQKAKEVGKIHFIGLVSDGGVHSHFDHLKYFLKAAKESGIPKAFVHFIADGRDTSPMSAMLYLKQLLDYFKQIQFGELATIVGRYYAMDRDKRWERIKLAFDAFIDGKGHVTDDPLAAVQRRYEEKETDEFLKPIIIGSGGRISQGDSILFFNYRSDRMRQIVQVFSGDTLPFPDSKLPPNLVGLH
jgi:2,3-bisphosphoglycerate-independent phosphoglycerate mutase